MKIFKVDHSYIKCLYPFYVEGKSTNREATIDKILIVHDYCGFEQDVTVLMLADQKFMTKLREKIEDWLVDEEYGQLMKPKQFMSDDDGPSAA